MLLGSKISISLNNGSPKMTNKNENSRRFDRLLYAMATQPEPSEVS